jgi:hypothetical protein
MQYFENTILKSYSLFTKNSNLTEHPAFYLETLNMNDLKVNTVSPTFSRLC